MIVVHGWWSVERDPLGQLIVWAEDSEAPPEPPPQRGRRPTTLAHPFALPGGDLAAVVAGVSLVGVAPVGVVGSAVLWLPTPGRGPDASAELLRARGAPPDPEAVFVRQWEVPTLALDPGCALELLCVDAGDPDADAPPLTPGADLRVLAAIAAFAASLATRGRVLPAVRDRGDGRASAIWAPVVTGADAAWLRTIVGALPGSLTAAVPPGADRDSAARRIVGAAADALVDAAVRHRLAPARRRRRVSSFRTALLGPDPSVQAPVGRSSPCESAATVVTDCGSDRAW